MKKVLVTLISVLLGSTLFAQPPLPPEVAQLRQAPKRMYCGTVSKDYLCSRIVYPNGSVVETQHAQNRSHSDLILTTNADSSFRTASTTLDGIPIEIRCVNQTSCTTSSEGTTLRTFPYAEWDFEVGRIKGDWYSRKIRLLSPR